MVERFSMPVQTIPEVHQSLYSGYWFFPWVKQPKCIADHPPPSTSVAKGLDLHLHHPSVLAYAYHGVIFTFNIT